jgi:hypothetical protein
MRSLVIALAAASLIALPGAAQDAPKPAPTAPAPMPAMAGHGHQMGPGAGMMSAEHKAMMARMDSMEARLATLVAEMNAASGSKKTNATAAALTQLVANHTAMRAHMQQMMMAGPMSAGMGAGMGAGAMTCGADAGGCCKDGCCCKPGAAMGCAAGSPPPEKKE